ncbi:hypothetical protein [Corynebacterium nuruki]|jgi:hypothetical protein|uniref:Uncharacterized protein n=1 Tax=Corynebacterium nuruki TaxID=1032851 RepID=A0A3D4T117_9CORY|nr:hypothetical protein [Corynebacterium nuruki]HCT15234.1 hypothetical protein [Corynebacterium nuruki]
MTPIDTTTVLSCQVTGHDLATTSGHLHPVTARFPHLTVTGWLARHCLDVPLFLADSLDATARHTAYAVTNILHDLPWDGDADGIADSSGSITDDALIISSITGDFAVDRTPDVFITGPGPEDPAPLLTILVDRLGLTAGGCVVAGADPGLAALGLAPWEHGDNVWWRRIPGRTGGTARSADTADTVDTATTVTTAPAVTA